MANELEEIQWYESYELGLTDIDNGHRQLVEIANEVIRDLSADRIEDCARSIERFIEALKAHFPVEEKFLEDIGYTKSEEHARNHQRLLARAENFAALCHRESDVQALKSQFSQIVHYTLADMRGADLEFRTYLVEKGINQVVL